MLRIPFTITHGSEVWKSVYTSTIKMFRDLAKLKNLTQILKSLLMLLSLPLLETIITISLNHKTTGLVAFSNI